MMEDTKEIIEMLKLINKRLDELEKRSYNPFPVIGPKSSEEWPKMVAPQKMVCPTCKIDFSGAMGYVCENPNCPIFKSVTC